MFRLIKIQKDEHIYSYIYRIHRLNGIFDFSNIISSSGRWVTFPKVLKQSLHYYEPIDDYKFLQLLRDIDIAYYPRGDYEDIISYQADLEVFFECGNESKRLLFWGYKPIQYCLDCIKEHIKSSGFAILKFTWMHNDHCPIHKEPLYITKSISRKKTIDALNNIYSGKHPFQHSTSEYMKNSLFDDRKYRVYPTCFSPCLMERFEQLILDKRINLFSSDKFLQSDYSGPERCLTGLLSTFQRYTRLKNIGSTLFVKYWRMNVEEIKVYTGVINKKSISENISKLKGKDCNKCNHIECLANPMNTKIGREGCDLVRNDL